MSRKRRPPIPPHQKVHPRWVELEKIQDDMPEMFEFLRVRDPQVMGPLLEALSASRTLFSCLPPGKRVIGVPEWAGKDLPWITVVDDLHVAAAGPTSFDQPFLEWWTNRAVSLIVDAATPVPDFYEFLGSSAAKGYRELLVQTVEARRLLWHEYFRRVRGPGRPAVVIDGMNNPGPGVPRQLLRVGRIGDDFGPRGPSSPGSFGALAPPE